MVVDIKKLAKENEALVIELRRHIHRYPELSSLEFETLKYIRAQLEKLGISYVEVPDGGILGFLGDESKGRTLLLRADIDALPILENRFNLKQEKTVVSEINGVHHACGHDAHTAMLITAAKILKENEDKLNGRVILFFERGEEGGGNIYHLLRYIEKEKIHIDAAHAIHVYASLPTGKFLVQGGPNHAGGFPFAVTITGSGGHGSRPDLSVNPIDAFVAISNAINGIRMRSVSPFETVTCSIGHVSAGSRSNIIPHTLMFEGTARFYNEDAGNAFIAELKHVLETVTKTYHCTYESKLPFVGLPVINNDLISSLIAQSVENTLGAEYLLPPTDPSMGSESYSLISKLYPSTLVLLGVANEALGSGAEHHNEYFDIDEAALHLGVAETAAFAIDFLNFTGEIPPVPYRGTISEMLKRP